ncbi:MAG: IS5 family transposase [Casimicrobiaceae bacterium]
MRGSDERQAILFSMRSIEDRIPADHPLRALRRLVDPLLVALSPRFQTLYASNGRPSIPPEQLLRALLLQVLYTIRSERQLMEQLDYNLLYRWFVGLTPDDAVWVPTVFTKNRDRLLDGNIAEAFFNQVLALANNHALLSHDHFTVDGTLLEAWASHKSFRPIADPAASTSDDDPSNPSVNFRGEKRANATHRSVTDPDARLAKKGRTGAILAYQASVLTENRHGLIVQTDVRAPGYHAERDAALEMLTCLEPRRRRRTLGADKGYDEDGFIADVRRLNITPHVAPNLHARRTTSAVDTRTTRHAGYAVSQRKRKLVEEGFGWGKCVGLLRKLHHRGQATVGWIFTFTSAAYNLVRLRTLLAPT